LGEQMRVGVVRPGRGVSLHAAKSVGS
jgi:hypothetical protein